MIAGKWPEHLPWERLIQWENRVCAPLWPD